MNGRQHQTVRVERVGEIARLDRALRCLSFPAFASACICLLYSPFFFFSISLSLIRANKQHFVQFLFCSPKNRCVVFSSQTEGSFVSDLFPWPSTFPIPSCQFLKFQARRFESCRRTTNLIDVSTLRHNDGVAFSQWP